MPPLKKRNLIYIAMALGMVAISSAAICVNFLLLKSWEADVAKSILPAGEGAPRPEPPVGPPAEPRVYSKEPASDLREMYKNFPEEDVGDDMPREWEGFGAEDKLKLTEVLDGQIDAAKKSLELDPGDRKARSKLFISESLKALALNGFNYKVEAEKSPGKPEPVEDKDDRNIRKKEDGRRTKDQGGA
jgi:hypothetical protein